MKNTTEAHFRQRLIKYAKQHGVTNKVSFKPQNSAQMAQAIRRNACKP